MTSNMKQTKFANYVPLPDPNCAIPDDEDFAQWCEHPITRFVASAYQRAAEKQREEWMQISWEQNRTDPLLLTELRTREDAYNAFLQTVKEGYVNVISK